MRFSARGGEGGQGLRTEVVVWFVFSILPAQDLKIVIIAILLAFIRLALSSLKPKNSCITIFICKHYETLYYFNYKEKLVLLMGGGVTQEKEI